MKKLLIAAVALLGFSGMAHAAQLDVALTSGGGLSYTFGGTYTPNVDLTTAVGSGELAFTGNAGLFTTTVANQHLTPGGTLFGGNYLAVLQTPGPGGTATLTMPSGQHALAFEWGSIDGQNAQRNILTIQDSRSVTYTITGQDIMNALVGFSVPFTNSQTDYNVVFYDAFGTLVNASFAANQNAFEAANFFTSAVPLPAALPLFAAALLGMAFVAYRRKAQQKV